MATISAYPHDWKEARRQRALELSQQGWPQCQIAEALGVSRPAVSQWLAAVREHGLGAIGARPHPGAPRRLTVAQLGMIPEFLSHGAEAYGFRGEVLTCARIAKIIEWELDVSYSKSHVSRLMKQIEWTPQKPIERATQRDEAQIENWRTEVWPELKKKARRERRKLVFVDESGFYLLPALVKTYAECGETPILQVRQTKDHLSVMSGITPIGQLFTLVRDEAMTGCESVIFLKHLLHCLSDKLLVIWDGSPIHRGAEVKTFLADGGAPRVHLESLPPYAPDLNPDEGVWDLLKYVELRNVCCLDLNHLHDELSLAIERLRNKRHLIRACFEGAGLAI